MTAHGKEWTEEEHQRLIDLISDGLPTQYIARVMKRSMLSVYSRLWSTNTSIRDIRSDIFQVRTPHETGRLFQVSYSVVLRWINQGFLKAKRYEGRKKKEKPKGYHRLITDLDLEEFLHCSEAWPSWDPGKITDPEWRDIAQEIRDTAGWHWLTVAEIAKIYHVSENTVCEWIYTEKFPAQRLPGKRLRWYVKNTDLEGFILPSEEYLGSSEGNVCELCGKEFTSKIRRAGHMPSCRKKKGIV